jgi:hypothetical protein
MRARTADVWRWRRSIVISVVLVGHAYDAAGLAMGTGLTVVRARAEGFWFLHFETLKYNRAPDSFELRRSVL